MEPAEYKLNFSNMDWVNIAPGLFEKAKVFNDQKVRLLRFEEDFIEADWCLNAHSGMVLSGNLNILFSETQIHYSKGDILTIQAGIAHKHKVVMQKGMQAEVLVFDKL